MSRLDPKTAAAAERLHTQQPSQSQQAALTDEQRNALEVARGLVRLGVPVVRWPGGQPVGNWQEAAPDLSVVDAWQPGDYLAAVTGVVLDGLDVDVQNDGEKTQRGLIEAGLWPENVLGLVRTGHGGTHSYVNRLRVRSAQLDGLDVRAGDEDGGGRGLLYLPPTEKVDTKTGEVLPAHRWEIEPDFETIRDELTDADPDLEGIRNHLLEHCAPSVWTREDAPHAAWDAMDGRQRARVLGWLAKVTERLEGTLARVAALPKGERTPWNPTRPDSEQVGWEKAVSNAAWQLGQYARADWTPWTADEARATLLRIVPAPVAAAVDPSRKWAQQAKRKDPAPFPAALAANDLAAVDEAAIDEDAFWNARPVLAHVHAFSRSRLMPPWPVLAAVLCRVAYETPPTAVVPPFIATAASLNLGVVLVAESGGGKDGSMGVADEAIEWPEVGWDSTPGAVGRVWRTEPGSGEGFAHVYRHYVPGKRATKDRDEEPPRWEWTTRRCMFDASESDVLLSAGSRNGSILLPTIRKVISGSTLGSAAYTGQDKRVEVPKGQYRATLTVAGQPTRLAPLIGGAQAEGGTPQRFLWLPTGDVGVPDEDAPEMDPWVPQLPNWPLWGERQHPPLMYPDRARQRTRDLQRARLRGEQTADTLDGHRNLTWLKVAALFAVLDGRLDVNDQDLDLAEMVMRKSDQGRDMVRRALAAKERETNTARAKTEGARAAIAEDTAEDMRTASLRDDLLRKVQQAGPAGVSRSVLLKGLAKGRRDYFGAAFEAVCADPRVRAEETTSGGTTGVKVWWSA